MFHSKIKLQRKSFKRNFLSDKIKLKLPLFLGREIPEK